MNLFNNIHLESKYIIVLSLYSGSQFLTWHYKFAAVINSEIVPILFEHFADHQKKKRKFAGESLSGDLLSVNEYPRVTDAGRGK